MVHGDAASGRGAGRPFLGCRGLMQSVVSQRCIDMFCGVDPRVMSVLAASRLLA